MTTSRKTEQSLHFDFAVIGGGLAGVCAAVAAARHGAKTAIIQDRPVFGGNSSSEIRVGPLGAASFNSWARETGILEEILLEERARNHDDIYDGMANSHYDLVLYETIKREPRLSMFMNTSIRGVDAKPLNPAKPEGARKIVAVHGSQLASEKEMVFKAEQYADCTGDATVGALAGAAFRYGRETRSEFNEPLAPVKADSQTMGSTLTMRARDIGRPVPFNPPNWIMNYRTPEDIGIFREPNRFNRVDYGGYWWIEVGTPFHQIDDNQVIKEELLKHVLGVWNYVKNHGKDKEFASNYALEWIGMVPGKRESRRLEGDVIMTEHDCHNDKQWPDRVAYGGWFIDLHTMGAILNKKEPGEPAHADANYRHWVRIPPFSIPLRALYSRNVTNLWMAGRNISVTHCALGATRVMMTHALQGQAIGTAAAYSIRNRISPRQAASPVDFHIAAIQQRLLRDDCNCFGVRNTDPDDLALGAKASATSNARLRMDKVAKDQFIPLDTARAVVFPVTHNRVNSVELYLKNANRDALTIKVELQKLERIWDRDPGQVAGTGKLEISAGFEGWVKCNLDAATTPGKPCRLCIPKTDGLFWGVTQGCVTGVVEQFFHQSAGGPEPKNAEMNTLKPHETALPAYEHWLQERWQKTPATRVEPAPEPFGPGNVNNGFAWPFGMPNLWISDPEQPLPQSVELDFGKAVTFDSVFAAFDTYLNAPYHDMWAFFRAPTCVRDWRLHARINGKWQKVFEEHGNYMRRRNVSFPAVTATALRLEVLATNTDPAKDPAGDGLSARVYEIRIYNGPVR